MRACFIKTIFPLVLVLPWLIASGRAEDAPVARVNGAPVSAAELEAAVDRMIPRASYHGNVSEETRDGLREKAIQDLIDQELQYRDAQARGIKADKKAVKDQMKQIRDRFKTKKEYQKALERSGLTEGLLRSRVEKSVVIQAATAKIVNEPAVVSNEAVKDYYELNREKFKQPETVRLALFSSKSQEKAKEALDNIKSGEDFGDVAAKMSEDKYRIRGGDLGYVHRGRLYPDIENSAFSLKVGETSGLIHTEGTWFIIKVLDRKAERQASFEESRDKLKKDLEAKRAGDLKEQWIGDLRSKAKIEILWKPGSVRNAEEKKPGN